MLKSVTFRSALVVAACALSISAHSMADNAKHTIDIPSGELGAPWICSRSRRAWILFIVRSRRKGSRHGA